MPNWKKLLSSGSNGSLNQLYVETSITASAFKGDGSQLTGITAPGTLSGSSQVDITQTTGYNTFSSSIQTYTDAKVASLVDSAPGTLDTLNELAAALNDDPNFSASIATSIGNRVLTSTFNTYSSSAHTQREALKYTDDKVKTKLNADGVVSGSYVESLPSGVVSGSSQIAFNDIQGNPFINGVNHITASHHLVPLTNETYDLGSSTKRWRDLYLSGSTIDLGGTIITRDNNGDINFKDSGTLALKRVVVDELQLGSGASARKLKIDNGKVKVTSKADADRVEDLALPTGTVSGSSQVVLSSVSGYSTYSSSVQDYTDAKITALSSSTDTHLDAKITALSSSVDIHLDANITALSGAAHSQRVAIANTIPTNTNELTNGAGFITSIDGALSGSSQVDITSTSGFTAFSSSIQTYTNAKVAALVDSSPATLDTLNELAAALGDDATFSASIATSIGNRVLTSTFNTYSGSSAAALRAEYTAAIPTNNNQLTNGAGYITGHPSISAAASVNNSGRTYIQDITLDSNGHVTGIASATETVTNTDTNYYLNGITKSGNTLTFSVNGTTNQTYEFGSNAFTSTTIPTNNNQLTNGAGYITGYSETDTLASVTSRGASTSNSITLSGNGTGLYFTGGNNRLYFSNYRAIEGATDGTNLQLAEGYNSTTIQSTLTVDSSTAGATVFQVEGTQGVLFSVDDSLTGDLFTVADSSAVPIFSVNSNGVVSVSGDLQITGDVTAYYSSDERLKKNITPIDNPLEKLKLISGNTFEWDEENTAHSNKGRDIGVVAQEIEKVLPEIVGERKGYKAVQYEKIVALLIESNKALLSRVEELEAKIK